MKIYVDGFERSGNTFLSAAIEQTLRVNTIPLFSHRISTLENRDKSFPFIVPLRDVLPTLVSAKIYRDFCWANNIQSNERTGDPDELIQRFSDYMDYLIKNEDLFICPFKEFTTDLNNVMKVIVSSFSGLNIVKVLTADEIIANAEHHEIFETPYLNNFPRQPVKEKEDVTNLFLSNYKKDLDIIQDKVNKLYIRYYERDNNGNTR